MSTRKSIGKKAYPLVQISWLDAYTESGWGVPDPSEELTYTYGLLVEKNQKWVVLAMTYCPEKSGDYFGNFWYIPRAMVRDIKMLDPDPMPHPVVSDPPSALPPTGDHGDGGSMP